ncbi:unnamed protein product [Musa acuminata subsp. burmannicoides]
MCRPRNPGSGSVPSEDVVGGRKSEASYGKICDPQLRVARSNFGYDERTRRDEEKGLEAQAGLLPTPE